MGGVSYEKSVLIINGQRRYGDTEINRAVRKNLDLFPNDFMFILNETEIEIIVSQLVIPSKQVLGGSFPYVFTEAGVAMLAGILKSKKAKEMNIAIMRAFVALRKMLLNTTELKLDIELIKQKLINNSKNMDYSRFMGRLKVLFYI